MRWLLRWWALIPLVLVLDVVTLFVAPFSPALRGVTACVLTIALLVFLALRWIEWRQLEAQKRAAYDSLARLRAAQKAGT